MKNFIISLAFVSFLFINAHPQTQLWGMTSSGGIHNAGIIFKINSDGLGFQNVYSFDTVTGSSPEGHLLLATNELFYGTAYQGGAYGAGGIFSFNPDNNIYSYVIDFNWVNGMGSEGSLIQAGNGKLYGTTDYGGDTANSTSGNGYGVIFSYDISNSSFSDLYHFQRSTGAYPNRENLLEGQNGKLYGLTFEGGAYNYGVIFSYDTASHTYLDLHDFDSIHGKRPLGGLVKAKNGKYYGLTYLGGINNNGTLFSFDPSTNDFALLYSFNQSTGWMPRGSLMQAADGKLYGMTEWGGLNNMGVIFSYDILLNNYSDLFDLTGIGSKPWSSLIESTNGKLYGMTYASSGVIDTVGNIFSFDPSSESYSNLHTFNGADGGNPCGDLTETTINFGIQLINNNAFSIYPNPSTGRFSITLPPLSKQIQIFSSLGQMLQTKYIDNENSMDFELSENGIYFIQVKTDKLTLTKKVVICR
jgi:uncharacterized repeat protein (TIGR03803 family)